MATVEGTISFRGLDTTTRIGVIRVRVVDASRADAPSRLIAEEELRADGFSLSPADPVVRYRIDCGQFGQRRGNLIVQVHASVSGARQVRQGDFVSKISYPIDPGQDRQQVNVVAEPV